MAEGYIYVLVNSSMPGLVKVGKTTRDPDQRASELSGATGVATPFVVAFKQFFFDCDAAEEFVHATLEREGLRQASNREFFRAQPSDVIRVVLQTPGATEDVSGDPAQDIDDDLLSTDDQHPDFILAAPHPWDDIVNEADSHYYGIGDFIRDKSTALELYKDAARLGSLYAYEKIADIYKEGDDGVKKNYSTALRYYKEGAKRGNYYCYSGMSDLFWLNENFENFHKSFGLFLRDRSQFLISEIEDFQDKHLSTISEYLFNCELANKRPRFLDELAPFADDVERYIKDKINSGRLNVGVLSTYKSLLMFACQKIKSRAAAMADATKGIQLQTTDQNKTAIKQSIFARLFKRHHWRPVKTQTNSTE